MDFNRCIDFSEITIERRFSKIFFTEVNVKNFTDRSSAIEFHSAKCDFTNFNIYGDCENFITDDTNFWSFQGKVSIWDKKVVKTAKCHKTIFDDVKINPFYLVTKCKDKSTLDLSRATLIDEWSRLLKKYSGLSLFIVFLLTFLFFLPLFTQSFFLLSLSKIDSSNNIFQKIPLWRALFFGGKEGASGVVHLLLTIVLLFYNIARLILTISIARLKEEENYLKNSSFHLASIHPEKLVWQLKLDKILSFIFWISISYTLLKLISTLALTVPYISNSKSFF